MDFETDNTTHEIYQRLQTSSSIRLLEILDQRDDGLVECSIESVNLDDNPVYSCLSYTWGDPNPRYKVDPFGPDYTARRPIKLNGQLFFVGQNLYDALNMLWDQKETIIAQLDFLSRAHSPGAVTRRSATDVSTGRNFIWIDAICIDQANISERNNQVSMMGKIFRTAQIVVAWLGPINQHIRIAMKLIDDLAADPDGTKRKFFTDGSRTEIMPQETIINPHGLDAIGAGDIDRDRWASLCAFFQLSWWNRAWVAQEVILAKSLLILTGSHSAGYQQLNWTKFVHASTYLSLSNWQVIVRRYCDPRELYDIDLASMRGMEVGNMRYAIQGNPGYHKDSSHLTKLWRVISSSRTREATDARDIIYSVLGYASLPDDARTTIIPDYNKSAAEVFTMASKAILRDAANLREFSMVEDRIERKTVNLPSWVPDYATKDIKDPLFMNGCRHGLDQPGSYRAAGRTPIYLEFPTKYPTQCIVSGHVLDKISAIVPMCGQADQPPGRSGEIVTWVSLLLTLPDSYRWTNESRTRTLWRTLCADLSDGVTPASEASWNSFNRWIIFQLVEYAFHHCSTEERLQWLLKMTNSLRDLGLVDPAEVYAAFSQHRIKAGMSSLEPFVLTYQFMYQFRKLFRTQDGYLGIAGRSMAVGDAVYVLAGGTVPYVLRDEGSGHFELMGEAYIHGAMQGENIHENTKWEKITLV